jgi:hypothetical protein
LVSSLRQCLETETGERLLTSGTVHQRDYGATLSPFGSDESSGWLQVAGRAAL